MVAILHYNRVNTHIQGLNREEFRRIQRRSLRNVLRDQHVCPDYCTCAYRHIPDDSSTCSQDYPIAYRRVALALFIGARSQSDIVIHQHVIAYDGCLADYDAHPMIDKETTPDRGTWMDFNASGGAREIRPHARNQSEIVRPEPVGHPVRPDCVNSRISEKDFQAAPRGRIAREGRLKVFPNMQGHLYSAKSLYKTVERYRSPKDGTTTTMFLPANSARLAT